MQRVADLTIEEFRAIIRETVRETMLEKDPDVGLELSDEMIAILSQPVETKDCIGIEDLAVKHGFKW
jgi:predicted DNA-binding protein (UPF0278 family)